MLELLLEAGKDKFQTYTKKNVTYRSSAKSANKTVRSSFFVLHYIHESWHSLQLHHHILPIAILYMN